MPLQEPFQRTELIEVEELCQFALELASVAHVLQRYGKLHVCFYGHEGLGKGHVGPGFLKLRLHAGSELLDVGVDVFNRAVFGYELCGANLSNAFYAGDVVGGVSADGKHVYHLGRRGDAPFFAELCHAHKFGLGAGFAGLQLKSVRADKLPVILVRGNHKNVKRLSGIPGGNGAYYVIGLKTGDHHYGDVHCLHKLREGLQGIYDKLRSGRAGAFVLRVHLIAESASRGVEGHGNVRGGFPLEHFQEVLGEPVEDGHVLSLGVYHGPAEERVVHLEYQRVAVYE